MKKDWWRIDAEGFRLSYAGKIGNQPPWFFSSALNSIAIFCLSAGRAHLSGSFTSVVRFIFDAVTTSAPQSVGLSLSFTSSPGSVFEILESV